MRRPIARYRVGAVINRNGILRQVRQSMDTIFITGLKVPTVIGVYDWERVAPQTLLLDIELRQNAPAQGYQDNLAATADYARAAALVSEKAAAWQGLLLETFAENVCAWLLADFAVSSVKVRVVKPGILPNAVQVGVVLERSR